jgi:hypothetical protein
MVSSFWQSSPAWSSVYRIIILGEGKLLFHNMGIGIWDELTIPYDEGEIAYDR